MNIYTFDSKGELLITIMSSLAQEESRSISENCTWGQRKRFSDGKVCVPYSRFLGYDKGEDGTLKLNEAEAVIVRRIFAMFLEGATPHLIAKRLTDESVPTPGGKRVWSPATVRRMLQNEKYKGDALLQKSYTVDFLTKKKKLNEGEIPQYYVENAHQAIIEPVVFDMVQLEMERRKPCMNHYSCVGMFSSRIKCGDCGSWYGPKVWHSNSKYRRTVYQCNRKCKGAAKCKTPHLYEEDIKRLFVSAMNKLLTDRKEIIANFKEIRETLFDTTALETERSELQSELTVVAELIQKCIDENAHVALNQTEYQERYNGLAVRFDTAKTRLEEVSEMVSSKKMRGERVDAFIAELVRQDGLLTEFDERLWFSLVDFATVYSENNVRFTFKDGTEIMA